VLYRPEEKFLQKERTIQTRRNVPAAERGVIQTIGKVSATGREMLHRPEE
jgi:hypothetical protein